jgi:dTDP-glucose 4,6-dehydratase
MRKLLVTGGAGFIGCNFVHHWRKTYPQDTVVVLDKLTYAGDEKNLSEHMGKENFFFIKGDICDQAQVESLLRKHDLDTIIHFAAESHVDRSIAGPDVFIETNVVGTHALLKAARTVWLDEGRHKETHRFHHISTDEVYGSLAPEEPAFTEENQYKPNSPYSASKAASDHLVRAYQETYGLNTSLSNCSNNYGPYQNAEKLIPLTISNILKGKPIPVYGDGKNIRDWLHVLDHCLGIDLIINKAPAGAVYNIGGVNELQNIDLIKLICRLIDEQFNSNPSLRETFGQCPAAKGESCASLIEFVTDRLGHDRRYAIDNSKISKELGFKPTYTPEQGIQETIAFHLDAPLG